MLCSVAKKKVRTVSKSVVTRIHNRNTFSICYTKKHKFLNYFKCSSKNLLIWKKYIIPIFMESLSYTYFSVILSCVCLYTNYPKEISIVDTIWAIHENNKTQFYFLEFIFWTWPCLCENSCSVHTIYKQIYIHFSLTLK